MSSSTQEIPLPTTLTSLTSSSNLLEEIKEVLSSTTDFLHDKQISGICLSTVQLRGSEEVVCFVFYQARFKKWDSIKKR